MYDNLASLLLGLAAWFLPLWGLRRQSRKLGRRRPCGAGPALCAVQQLCIFSCAMETAMFRLGIGPLSWIPATRRSGSLVFCWQLPA